MVASVLNAMWGYALLFTVLLGTVIVGRFAFGLLAKAEGYSLSAQTLDHDNSAVTVRWAGMMVAVIIAMLGVFSPSGGDGAMTLAHAAFAFVFGFAALVASRYLNDYVILHMVDNNKAVVEEKNLAVAIVEFSTYCATACIFAGGISAPDHSIVLNVWWFVIGQLILVGLAYGYHRLFPNVFDQISKGNEACALSFAGLLLAAGMAVGSLVHGPSNGFVWDLIGIAFSLGVWLALMAATRAVIYLGFASPERHTSELVVDRNWSLGLIDFLLFVVITAAFIKIH